MTYSHLDVRFERWDRSSNRKVLKPDMAMSGLSSCPASMSGLRPKLVEYSSKKIQRGKELLAGDMHVHIRAFLISSLHIEIFQISYWILLQYKNNQVLLNI